MLDLSSVILGPMAGQLLDDMGAGVIKVEAPEGDVTRAIGPRRSQATGSLFLLNNRNKRSVVLDPKAADGQSTPRRRCASTGSRQKRSGGWRAAGLDRPGSAQGGRHRRSSP